VNKERGFTLAELMITLAVVGILAAIALPFYGDYVTRAKVADAVNELATMRARMDEYFLDHRTYVGACTDGTIAPLPAGEVAYYFDFSCSNLSPNTYTVMATGRLAAGMDGFSYSVDQNNLRATLSVPADWTASASCWTLREDGSC